MKFLITDQPQPGGKPFSNAALLQAFAEVSGSELRYIVAETDGQREAWMPMFSRKKASIPMIVHPQLLPYLPIVFGKNDTLNPLQELEIQKGFAETLQSQGKRLLFNLPTSVTDVRGFLWNGFQATPRYTYRYPLKENIRYQRLKYRDIKKAQKLNPVVREELDFDLFLRLKEETYHIQTKRFPYSDVSHTKLLKNLAESGCLRQYVLRIDQEDISTQLILEDDHEVYTWQGFTRRDFLREGITSWFNDYLINRYRETHDSLDFCGANIPDIARYKSGFSGSLTVYYQLTWSASPMLDSTLRFLRRNGRTRAGRQ